MQEKIIVPRDTSIENRILNVTTVLKAISEYVKCKTCNTNIMRVLGLGLKGAKKFCGLMDMPAFITQNTYDLIINNMHGSKKTFSACLRSRETAHV